MKSIVWSAVVALIVCAACVFLPMAALQNLWRVAELIDMPDVAMVLYQLNSMQLTPGYVPAAVCAAAVFAVAYLLRRHKIIAGLLIAVLAVAGIAISLLAVKSANVPVYTIVKILMEYVQLGAF